MILGYVEQPSPRAGGSAVLRVSTDAPCFRVEVYRWETGMVPVAGTGWQDGQDVPAHLPHQDWGREARGLHGEVLPPWPAYDLPIGDDWPSGAYVAVLVEGDGQGGDRSAPDRTTPDGREGRALFAVRAAAPGRVLYKLPVHTYHAYDVVAPGLYDLDGSRWSWCFYNHVDLPVAVPRELSLHRPGGGTGGCTYDIGNFDPYDPTPRQTFVHWDALFLAWLAAEGVPVDLCTDVDLHREGAELLAPYRLLVSAGHDEYWTAEMRDAVEGFVADGGNAAFFSGNTCWWRVEYADEVTFRREEPWYVAGRPENSMLGTSFRNGGERDRDEHPVGVGYRVQHADHWAFAGTGLRDGDVFGADEHLVGYECDGAAFDRTAGSPVVPTGEDGTPAGFTVLGVGDVTGWGFGNAAATMGVLEAGGTVFNGATTDWPRLLSTSPVVAQITRNVLGRLG